MMLLAFSTFQKLCSQNITIDSTFIVGTGIFSVAPIMNVKDNSTNVPHKSFYTFYDSDLTGNQKMTLSFTIQNNGDAQLNLFETNTIASAFNFTGINKDDFYVDESSYNHIIPKGGESFFDVIFTLKSPINEVKIATLTIDVIEPDIEDYEITLVFADCEATTDPEEITGTVTWPENSTTVKFSDVYVKSGATLTIKGDVGFAPEANLFIEAAELDAQGNVKTPAGKVYIDGGHITALCNYWKGVDVWGHRSLDQFTTSNQGLIKIMNGGMISSALVGIETIKHKTGGDYYSETSGGIVKINDGEIHNCTRGIHLYPYQNIHPYSYEILNNLSYFRNARFYNDYNLFPKEQLYLEEVDGITIYGCSFKNFNPLKSHPITGKSYGIKSENSSFVVDKFIDEEENIIQSRFIKHNYGIHATSSGRYLTEIIRIDSSYFDDNETGIYMGAVDKPQITRNDFLVKNKYTKFEGEETIGLYLDTYTTAFVVEENNFYSTLSISDIEAGKCNGITANNTGEDYNEIYNNSFDKLTIGITAAGTNREEISDIGLCIKCNDFVNTKSDIYVTTATNPVGNEQGIDNKQGELAPVPQPGYDYNTAHAAGNTFTKQAEGDNFIVYNYYNADPNSDNGSCEPIKYTYHGVSNPIKVMPDPTYPPSPSSHLELTPDPNVDYESKETACPSNFNGGGIEMMAMTIMLTTESEAVIAYSDTLDMFVDGGNTTALNLDVSTSLPDESLVLRQQLLEESPYLSDTVMKSAIDKENVLPNAMLRDVLVANPQSAKSPDVMLSINNRNTSMPDYMMVEIEDGASIEGGKDLLTNKLAKHKTNRDKALTKLLLHYMADTINIADSHDSIIMLLQNRQYPGPRYQLAMLYLNEGDSVNTFNTLDNIEFELELSEDEDFAHNLFVDLTEIQWQLKSDTTIADSLQIESLLNIAENSNTHAGIYARNMLVAMGEMEYQEPHYFPLILKAKPIFGYNMNKGKQRSSYLKIFPNPANDYFTIETKIDREFNEAKLVLLNLEGKGIKQIALKKKRNQIIVATEDCITGTYLLKLVVNGKMIESKKVLIVK